MPIWGSLCTPLHQVDFFLLLYILNIFCIIIFCIGLDLPMKVVDMFGCHLPVLAKRFSAIHELVTDGVTGMLFDTANELKLALVELSAGFPRYSQVWILCENRNLKF